MLAPRPPRFPRLILREDEGEYSLAIICGHPRTVRGTRGNRGVVKPGLLAPRPPRSPRLILRRTTNVRCGVQRPLELFCGSSPRRTRGKWELCYLGCCVPRSPRISRCQRTWDGFDTCYSAISALSADDLAAADALAMGSGYLFSPRSPRSPRMISRLRTHLRWIQPWLSPRSPRSPRMISRLPDALEMDSILPSRSPRSPRSSRMISRPPTHLRWVPGTCFLRDLRALRGCFRPPQTVRAILRGPAPNGATVILVT